MNLTRRAFFKGVGVAATAAVTQPALTLDSVVNVAVPAASGGGVAAAARLACMFPYLGDPLFCSRLPSSRRTSFPISSGGLLKKFMEGEAPDLCLFGVNETINLVRTLQNLTNCFDDSPPYDLSSEDLADSDMFGAVGITLGYQEKELPDAQINRLEVLDVLRHLTGKENFAFGDELAGEFEDCLYRLLPPFDQALEQVGANDPLLRLSLSNSMKRLIKFCVDGRADPAVPFSPDFRKLQEKYGQYASDQVSCAVFHLARSGGQKETTAFELRPCTEAQLTRAAVHRFRQELWQRKIVSSFFPVFATEESGNGAIVVYSDDPAFSGYLRSQEKREVRIPWRAPAP